MSDRPELSVVIPLYDEEAGLPELDRRLRPVLDSLGMSWEVIFVNDGSRDATLSVLKELRSHEPRYKIIDLSRNFGHQLAISAGLDHARGDATVVMDGDLQDPPEVIPALVKRWREGFDVVYAVRRNRKENALKRTAYLAFYRLLQRMANTDIPLDSGDFSLMDRRVLLRLVELPERSRFIRGLRAWVGFRQIAHEYDRESRFAGEPKYSFRKLLRLGLDGIFSFSEMPLRFATLAGVTVTGGAAVLALWTLFKRLIGYQVVPGFATIAILVLFFGGVQLMTIGILGEYIARIYTEVKGRPRYVIRELDGLASPEAERKKVVSRSHPHQPGPGESS